MHPHRRQMSTLQVRASSSRLLEGLRQGLQLPWRTVYDSLAFRLFVLEPDRGALVL